MASGVIELTRTGYGQMFGRIVWESVSNGSAANTSTVTATLQVSRKDSYVTTGTWKGNLKVGSVTKSFSVYHDVSSGWFTLQTVTTTISHNNNGSGSCYIYGTIQGPSGTSMEYTSTTGSKTVTLDTIPRFAVITAAPNFNDEENPTITYSNPAGKQVGSLQACISFDKSADDIVYRDISKTGTSYTFNLTSAERDVLRAATTTSNSRTVYFFVRSTIGNAKDTDNLGRTLTIKNPKPTINPTIKDTNSTTVALTGDSSILVKYYSNAAVTIGAAAVKKASLKSQKVVCGNKSLTANGTMTAIESNSFVFTATDSRGNTTTKTVKPSFVNYVKLTCSLGNNMPDGEGNMTVKVSGNYFNGSFGTKSNSLNVYYRYKTVGGSYSSWTAMTVTKSGNTYSATANLTGLDYQTTYVVQAYAQDALATVNSVEKNVKATPVFDWGDSDFKFNVPVYNEDGNLMAKTNNVTQAGTNLNDYITEGWYFFQSSSVKPTNIPAGSNGWLRVFVNTTPDGNTYYKQLWYRMGTPGSNDMQTYVRTHASVLENWGPWTKYITETDLLNEIYPVNSIYISYSHTSPASLFGGTWHRIESRFLWGTPSTGTIGATAGEMTHTLTASEIPSHRHDGLFYAGNNKTIGLNKSSTGYTLTYASDSGNGKNEIYTGTTGGGAAHNNMPPYVNVAIWRRTA